MSATSVTRNFASARAKPAGVVDLAAAGGVEGGAVENDCWARGFDHRTDFGVKMVEKRIVVVEAVGHAFFSIGIEREGNQVVAIGTHRTWDRAFDVIFVRYSIVIVLVGCAEHLLTIARWSSQKTF